MGQQLLGQRIPESVPPVARLSTTIEKLIERLVVVGQPRMRPQQAFGALSLDEARTVAPRERRQGDRRERKFTVEPKAREQRAKAEEPPRYQSGAERRLSP